MKNFNHRWEIYTKLYPLKPYQTIYTEMRFYLKWCFREWRLMEKEFNINPFEDMPRKENEGVTSVKQEFAKRDLTFNRWIELKYI